MEKSNFSPSGSRFFYPCTCECGKNSYLLYFITHSLPVVCLTHQWQIMHYISYVRNSVFFKRLKAVTLIRFALLLPLIWQFSWYLLLFGFFISIFFTFIFILFLLKNSFSCLFSSLMFPASKALFYNILHMGIALWEKILFKLLPPNFW